MSWRSGSSSLPPLANDIFSQANPTAIKNSWHPPPLLGNPGYAPVYAVINKLCTDKISIFIIAVHSLL